MKKQPCIRGLNEFKKGCPRCCWNEEAGIGCPAWIDKKMKAKNGEDIHIKECLDLYMARLHYSTNALLEGNQQAIEKFRNNMSVEGMPKPDPALKEIVEFFNQSAQLPFIELKRPNLLSEGD